MNADEILELLRVKMNCRFLSDLPSLTGEQRAQMLFLIAQLPQNIVNSKELEKVHLYLHLRETA
ncbi:hypothetical protein [uncultured Agathobaculum sp.]|uniref:hypothetical protein n=1 Tax=uncultured Agathobaculum sp. TaxID=2048140 RepID=UPI00296FF943